MKINLKVLGKAFLKAVGALAAFVLGITLIILFLYVLYPIFGGLGIVVVFLIAFFTLLIYLTDMGIL